MKLELNSKVDKGSYPFTHKWDSVYRQNYDRYQALID